MIVKVLKNPYELGKAAADHAAYILNNKIAEEGMARMLLSTGASQFDTLQSLLETNVDWSKVEMFHLDEYINLPETHPASFRKYLKERFVSHTNLKNAYFVNGEGDINQNIRLLTRELERQPIDLGLIGIGENAHIAFNDPPADFETKEPYIIVSLDDSCKKQQVGEGWFKTINDVPNQAISMSVHGILQCHVIISCVPYKVKANAVRMFLESELTNKIPATALKEHPDFTLYLDDDSASTINADVLKKFL